MPPDSCPNCGAEIPPRARACPDCGADERTGWSDHAHSQRLGIPDPETFDHDAFVASEFHPATARSHRRWWWWLLAFLAIGAVLWTRIF